MQGPRQEGSGDVVSDINITPLCDILVVLLIIFMITAQQAHLQGPQVSSPADSPASPKQTAEKDGISIIIGADNTVSCDGTMVEPERLTDWLTEHLPATRKHEVMIRANPTLQLERVMKVMEGAELAGKRLKIEVPIGIGTQIR